MALIGNPQDFDRIRQRYESLVYPRSGSRRTSSLAEDRFNQLATQGMLSQNVNQTSGGLGSQVISQDATSPGEGVQFRVNPITGATETIIPEYMGGFRQDETDFFPGGGYQTGYDVGDSMIDPATGMPRGILGTGQTGTGIPLTQPRTGGGDGRDDRGIQTSNFGTLASSVANYNPAIAGLLSKVTGLPLGFALNAMNEANKNKLKDDYGIETDTAISQIADVYNQSIAEGNSSGGALIDATLQGGVALTDQAFDEAGVPELSINDLLADFQSGDEGGYSPSPGTTGPGGTVGGGSQPQGPFGGGGGDGNQGNSSSGGGYSGGGGFGGIHG